MNALTPWLLATLTDIPTLFWLAPLAGLAALIMARVFAASVMKRSEGDDEMIRIAQAVHMVAGGFHQVCCRIVLVCCCLSVCLFLCCCCRVVVAVDF